MERVTASAATSSVDWRLAARYDERCQPMKVGRWGAPEQCRQKLLLSDRPARKTSLRDRLVVPTVIRFDRSPAQQRRCLAPDVDAYRMAASAIDELRSTPPRGHRKDATTLGAERHNNVEARHQPHPSANRRRCRLVFRGVTTDMRRLTHSPHRYSGIPTGCGAEQMSHRSVDKPCQDPVSEYSERRSRCKLCRHVTLPLRTPVENSGQTTVRTETTTRCTYTQGVRVTPVSHQRCEDRTRSR